MHAWVHARKCTHSVCINVQYVLGWLSLVLIYSDIIVAVKQLVAMVFGMMGNMVQSVFGWFETSREWCGRFDFCTKRIMPWSTICNRQRMSDILSKPHSMQTTARLQSCQITTVTDSSCYLEGEGQLNCPRGVDVSANGHLYIAT